MAKTASISFAYRASCKAQLEALYAKLWHFRN